jgi:hypothetical protein
MNYYSQAGQDKWVEEILVKGEGITSGTFLDIGCGGELYSNTLGFEQAGWRGWLVDNSEEAFNYCMTHRKSPCFWSDAAKMDWYMLPHVVDYLSLDIDDATLEALRKLPLDRVQFRVATIEHDSWRFGDVPRNEIRKVMLGHGYTLARADVLCGTEPFEDWFIKKDLLTHDYH